MDTRQAIRWDHNASEKLTIRLTYMQTASSSNNNGFWGDDNFPSVSSDEKYTALLSSRRPRCAHAAPFAVVVAAAFLRGLLGI